MKVFLSHKKVLTAAILLCLSGIPSVSMAEFTDTQVIEGEKKYAEDEIIINVRGKADVAGFKAEDDEKDNVVTIGQNGKGTAYIATESSDVGNSLAAGVTVGPATNLTINGNLNIKSVYGGSCFANGLAILNMGTGTGGKGSLVVNGDVTIGDPALQEALTDSSDDKNWGVNAKEMHGGYGPDGHVHDGTGAYNYTGARWSPTGISATCSGYGSTIDLNGNVYVAMRGSALKTDPYYMDPNMSSYDLVTINANKGDVIIYTPYSTKESFYVAANYGGTININMNGMAGAGHKVDLTGNIIALKNYNKSGQPFYYQDGRINLALDNKASTWTGVVDNTGKNQAGEVNLWVQNGSTWTHLSPSKTNGLQSQNMPTPSKDGHYGRYDGTSHVANLHGGKEAASAGNIIAKDKAKIQIKNYDGYTNVFYAHEGNGEAEENYKAGNIVIEKAKTGSGISLVTDSDGVAMTNEDSIAKVLNALAGKLIYSAYANGEKNLTGSVKIAEGLTAASKEKKIGDIEFTATGKGSLKPGSVKSGNPSAGGEAPTEFTQSITGNKAQDKIYADTGVLKDDGEHYVFTKDTTITGFKGINVAKDVGHAVDVNAKDHTLTFVTKLDANGTEAGVAANSLEGVTITAKKLVIDASSTKGRIEGINIGGQGQANKDRPNKLTINGDTFMKVRGIGYTLGLYAAGNSEVVFNGDVTMLGDETSKWGLTSKNGAWGYYGCSFIYSGNNYTLQMGPKVTVNGDVYATIDGNGLFGNGGHSKLTINGGGNIEINKDNDHNYYALLAECATTSLNVVLDENYKATAARNNKLILKGNISASTGALNVAEPERYTYVNLGLATKDSEWTGVAYNKFNDDGNLPQGATEKYYGEIKLFLQNGAVWNNEAWGAVEKKAFAGKKYDGSHLTYLIGGSSKDKAGNIFQKETHPLTIDNLKGYVNVYYAHEGNGETADSYKTGDTIVRKAEKGAGITLVTDSTGITMTNEDSVTKALNALAGKLIYKAYVTGEKNLTGKVQIAEGLTTSSASMKVGNVAFKKENGQGEYKKEKETPSNFTTQITGDKVKDKIYADSGVIQADGTYLFTDDASVVYGGSDAKPDSAVLAEKDVTINAQDKTLTIQGGVSNWSNYSGNIKGKNISITAKKLVLLADKNEQKKSYAGAMVLIDGIWSNAGYEQSHLTINGDVDMTYNGDMKSRSRGIYLAHDAIADFNGNLKMNVTGEVSKGLDSSGGGHTIGINADGTLNKDNSRKVGINVNGTLDLTTNGTGVRADGYNSEINIKGGSIKLTPNTEGPEYSLYADSFARIHMNMNKEKTDAGNQTVNIQGNILASAGSYEKVPDKSTTVNLGLTGAQSSLDGLILAEASERWVKENGVSANVNLWLKNGATWTNEVWGSKFRAWSSSHVHMLHGGADAAAKGVIIQKDKDSITVDNYSGHTLVLYSHDKTNPKMMIGGDFIINKAEKGSEITLRTDNTGLNVTSDKAADKNLVSETLNALANKLYYTAYKDGETNLKGKVEIAEGLTAQSASKRLEDMTFKKENGQGQYVFTPEEDKPPVSDEGPIKKTTTLTKDRTVTWSEVSAENYYISTLYTEKHTSKQEPMVVDLNGNNLTLNAESANKTAAAIYVGENEYIDIKNTNKDKKLSITATNTKSLGADAIYLSGNSHLTITGPVSIDKVEAKGKFATGISSQGQGNEVLIEGPLTIKNVKSLSGSANGNSVSGILLAGERSKVTVTGPVDISGVEGSSLKTLRADTEISIGGGTITAAKDADHSKHYYAAKVDKGTININMKDGKAGDTKTQITGDLYAAGQYGKRVVEYSGGQLVDWADAGVLNVALTDKDSFWTGAGVYDSYTSKLQPDGKTVCDIGKFNLHLKNGATWTNEKQSHGTMMKIKSTKWTGSILATLEGGDDAAHAGVIIQKESTPIHILDYKGHTTVIYKHDKTDPKKMIGGDFIINKAEKDSMITLRTDNEGMNALSGKKEERNKVSEVLNALANKLYYKAYKDGETNLKGKVEIAEGLTAQSASYRLEDMTFKKENGQGQYLFTPETEDKPDKPKPGEDPKPPTPDKPEPPVIYGPKQTAMMRGAKSAMTTTMLSMRDNMTTMTQRLGDIHEGTEDGIWARTYGGKANYDKDQTKTKENFWGVQIGADKKQASGWHTGVSFDYQDGNATYELGGKGDPKLYTLGIYGTKVKDNGEYIDVVAKAGRGQNDYTVYNDMGHKLKGDYKANAYGLSVEYGKRIEKGDKYLTPQIQLSYMKLKGTDYDAISDYANGKKMHVEQDGMTSLVGRIGIAAGKRTDKTDLYLKANLLHEFKGTTASTFSAENEPTGKVDQDFGDTWAELTLGVNHNIDKDKMIYADITKSFGGDYEMEWKANAGIRLRF